jgi:hypothetical protein
MSVEREYKLCSLTLYHSPADAVLSIELSLCALEVYDVIFEVRIVFSYPSKAHSQTGIGPDLCWFDPNSFQDSGSI